MKHPLTDVVERCLRALKRHLPRAAEGHVRAVHQARVASRRLREILPVVLSAAPDLDLDDLTRDVRRITRGLGAVREVDVALQEFDGETGLREWTTPAADRVRRHLTSERTQRALEMRLKLDRVSAKRLHDRTMALVERLDAPAAAHTWQRFLQSRLRKRAKALLLSLRTAGVLYNPEAIHEVRIAGKKLRYTLEVAKAASAAPVGRDIATLKRLQDLLGRLRDLQVLQGHIRITAVDAAGDLAMMSAFEGMDADLETECRTLHAQFLSQIDRWMALALHAGTTVSSAPRGRPARARLLPRTRSAAARPSGGRA